MKSARLVLACITLLATPLIAIAAPGDPRLVNGVLEWPRTVTSESFVIVRGDDGVLYYVGIAASRRDGTITAGNRVAVLGIEGRSPHEVTAVGFGSGATTEAALAQLQGARQAAAPVAAPTPAAPPAAASAAPAAPPATATVATPAAAPAVPAAAPSQAPMATSAPAPPAPPAGAPVAAPPAAPAATPVAPPTVVSPRPAAPAPAPAATALATPSVPPTPAPVGSPTPPATASAAPTNATAAVSPAPAAVVPAANPSPKTAVAPPPLALSAPMLPVDDRRWTEVSGEIEAFVGRTVVLKVDGGRVTVDVSSLSGNLERIVAPGTRVKFYGVPVELRFKAMGFIDPDARAPEARGRVR